MYQSAEELTNYAYNWKTNTVEGNCTVPSHIASSLDSISDSCALTVCKMNGLLEACPRLYKSGLIPLPTEYASQT